jgi:hypothetical protein
MNNPLDVFNAICLKNQNSKNVNHKFLELLQLVLQMSEFHGEQNNVVSQMETLFTILTDTARELIFKNQRTHMIKLHSDAHTQTEEIERGPKLRGVINNAVQNDFTKLKLNPVNFNTKDGSKKVFPTISKVKESQN